MERGNEIAKPKQIIRKRNDVSIENMKQQ